MLLKDMVFSSIGALSKESILRKHLSMLNDEEISNFGQKLKIITDLDLKMNETLNINIFSREFVTQLFIDRFVYRPMQIDKFGFMPLYPSETMLWDSNQLPRSSSFTNDEVFLI
jgi:hypothetical protein